MTAYDRDTPIEEVLSDPSFGEYARLLFPIEEGYYSGDTLGTLSLVWYNNIDPNKTVEIVNSLKERANAGQTIFYDIYTEEEKIRKRKRHKIRTSGIQAYSFSKDPLVQSLLCAMQVAGLHMLAPCRIVFLTLWSFPNWAITRLL